MRRPRRSRPAALVVVLTTAAAVTGLVGLGAFALQAAVLPRASEEHLIASRITRELLRYRASYTVHRLGGRPPVRAVCRHVWVPPEGSARRWSRGVRVSVENGHQILVARGRLHPDRGRARADQRTALIEVSLAACPRLLAANLARRLRLRDLDLEPHSILGHPAYRVVIRRQFPQITLYVAQRTLRPLAVQVAARRLRGWSSILLERPGVTAAATRSQS